MTIRTITIAVLLFVPAVKGAEECVNGMAGAYACSNVELRDHLDPAELGGSDEGVNDIWGWTDPDSGEEYALVGMYAGTAFVRLDAEGNGELLGRLPGTGDMARSDAPASEKSCRHDEECGESAASSWRDIKVYANHAYIVSEETGHGLQVFNLERLRNALPESLTPDAHYTNIGHAHNIFINEDSARAYIVGAVTSPSEGGLHVVDISLPAQPVLLGNISSDGYTHDVQCVVYTGPDNEFAGEEICLASNVDTVTIWQVTDVANPEILARFEYAEYGYVHQGWLSEDQRYFFFNDETDERHSGNRTHTRVLDVSNLRDPQLVADYLSPSLAIDHNNYVHGRWLLQSNYTSGLRILDVLDPEHPVQAGFFDTFPGDDSAIFDGNWSNYRFPGSGLIVLSDMTSGLYVVKPTIEESGVAPDLGVSLALDETEVEGDTVSGEFTIHNGTATDASKVLLTVHLPASAKFSSFTSPEGWQCERQAEGRVRACRIEEFTAGAENRFSFEILGNTNTSATVIAMAYAGHADVAPGDNLDSATVSFIDDSAPPDDAGDGGGDSGGTGRGGGGGALFWLALLMPGFARGRRKYSGSGAE